MPQSCAKLSGPPADRTGSGSQQPSPTPACRCRSSAGRPGEVKTQAAAGGEEEEEVGAQPRDDAMWVSE